MKFSVHKESRLGRRKNNEDRIAYCYSRDALLLVVADGMGGHLHGEVAAQIAVQLITGAFQREAAPRLDDPFHFLSASLASAHRAILDSDNMEGGEPRRVGLGLSELAAVRRRSPFSPFSRPRASRSERRGS